MKLLIIEGPDRCGKNTLIRNLTSQAENYVVRHFGSAKGKDNFEKRNFQFQFFKKEFELASLRPRFEILDKERYPRDIWIMNRAHLGEFVYGKMYRETHPEQWVMQMEKLFGMDLDPSIYLLLLTAPAEFLCRRDDGLSFSNNVMMKQAEIAAFRNAYDRSSIVNKMTLDVSNGEEYLDQNIILESVNKFLGFEQIPPSQNYK
jgi:thymidylate kinase